MTTRPRFAYLVLSHQDVPQVEALVARVLALSPTAVAVVHHDAADPEVPWGGQPPDQVVLADRRHLAWGDWSLVDALLRMVHLARTELQSDWFVVLSGTHWPVTDLAAWEADVATSGVDALAPSRALPRRMRFGIHDYNDNRFLARCRHRWVKVPIVPRGRSGERARNLLIKVARRTHPVLAVETTDHRDDCWFVGVPRRQAPMAGWRFRKGPQWTAFDRRAADALLSVDGAVVDWFRKGHIADETFVPTVLHHTPGLVVSDRLATYVPRPPLQPVDRWMDLTIDSLPAVWSSGAAFARKVDLRRHPEVVAALDAAVDGHRRRPRAVDGDAADTTEATDATGAADATEVRR